jgi:hypothetical protein
VVLPQRAHTAALAGSAARRSGPSQVSSGQAPLCYIIANHTNTSLPTRGHALLQIAVCLQHSTLLIDWLEQVVLVTSLTCVLLWLIPAAMHELLPGVQAPSASVGSHLPVEALLDCPSISGLLCKRWLMSQHLMKSHRPCITTPG